MTVYFALIVSVFLFLIDYVSKSIIANYCTLGDSTALIDGFLRFEYAHNYGAAFGSMQNMRILFIIVTVCLVGVMLVAMLTKKVKNNFYIWTFALIISGGVGNLADRIFNKGGYVVDFLCFEFDWFPYIFNFADICIVIGGVSLILYMLVDLIKGFGSSKDQEDAEDVEALSEDL